MEFWISWPISNPNYLLIIGPGAKFNWFLVKHAWVYLKMLSKGGNICKQVFA